MIAAHSRSLSGEAFCDPPSRFAGSVQTPRERRHSRLLGWFTSLALVAAVLFALRSTNPIDIAKLIPRSPQFWLVFVTSYLTAPFADWIIFRRLWGIGWHGFVPLLRKSVLNSLIVSYTGETYFYAWVRARKAICRNPFGAIKDVAILSALVGNAATLALVIAAWPMLKSVQLGAAQMPLLASVAVLAAISLSAIVFRGKVFHLRPVELAFVGTVHLVRTILCLGLVALLWHLAMPAIAIQWWLLLSTGRMIVSRLPLIANKDLAFAGVAAFLFQHDLAIVQLMAMTAMLIFCANLSSAVGLLISDFKSSLRADGYAR